MKTKKRVFSFLAGVVMTFTGLQTVALADETNAYDSPTSNVEVISVEELDDGTIQTTYEIELTPESVDENGVATYSTRAIDSSFTMTGSYYRGADRVYSGNCLSYQMTVTAADGTAVDKQVSIQLCDYNHTQFLREDIIDADGITVKVTKVPITANRTYYFKYYLAYGSSSNLKIRMVINTWTE